MKKRTLATFLALCLMLSLLPVSAMAVGNDYPVYTGEQSDKIIFNDGATHTVILRDLKIDRHHWFYDNGSAIDISNNTTVTLILEGTNSLTGDTNSPAIWVEGGSSLIIEGDGEIRAQAGTA